jgi:hypothetical protein
VQERRPFRTDGWTTVSKELERQGVENVWGEGREMEAETIVCRGSTEVKSCSGGQGGKWA